MSGLVGLIDTVLRRRLPQMLADAPRAPLGTVTSTAPLQVLIDGETASIDVDYALDAYTPVLNDRVRLLGAGSDLTVLGKVIDHG